MCVCVCVCGGGPTRFLPAINVFIIGRTDLPQEAFRPKWANRFSRGTGGSVPDLLMKSIAT